MKFIEVTKTNKCPICGKSTWCTYSDKYIICRRVLSPSAKCKTDKNGQEYYLYRQESYYTRSEK